MPHAARKTSSEENLIRSAKAPTIRAGVNAKKVSWKVTNTYSGIEPETVSPVIPLKKAVPNPPT